MLLTLRKKKTWFLFWGVLLITMVSAATPPTQTTPLLESSPIGSGYYTDNLTCYNQSTSDIDGDPVKNIFNWYRNDTSLQVLNMPFENNTIDISATTKDYSPYQNNGTVTSATWTATGGYDGWGAYEFDGVNDAIQVPYSSELFFNATTEMTWSMWVYVVEETAGFDANIFVSQGTHTIGGYAIGRLGGGNITFATTSPSFPLSINNLFGNITLNNWHHIAVVKNSTAFYAYQDGLFTRSIHPPAIAFGPTTNSTELGNSTLIKTVFPLGNHFLNGTLDEVQRYNVSLTPEQILALYNNRTDLIVSNETVAGENWTCEITPNDNFFDGTTLKSNNITIIDKLAPHVEITYPQNISYPNASAPTTLNYTITFNVSVLDVCWYSTDNGLTNNTLADCDTNATGLTTIIGLNNWTIYVNDTTGELNQSTVYFTVTAPAPPAPNGSIISEIRPFDLTRPYVRLNNITSFINRPHVELNKSQTFYGT